MFNKNIVSKQIVCVLIMLFFIGSTAINAQQLELERAEKKVPKSVFKMFHNRPDLKVHLPTRSQFKVKADNDIASWVQQGLNEEDWMDLNRAFYEYNSNRTIITKHLEYANGDEWFDSGFYSITHNPEGFPLKIVYDAFGIESTETFYYSPSGRLDSLIYEGIYFDESYSEKVEFNYITEDSIRIIYMYYDDYEERDIIDESGYLLMKDGNFIEVYDEADYIDRYTYYNITMDDYIKAFGDEFFFVEMLNEEFYDEVYGITPYMRISLTKEDGLVTDMQIDYYQVIIDQWFEETKYTYTYEDGKIVMSEEAYINELDEFQVAYRTLYTYGATVSADSETDQINAFKMYQNYPNPFNPTTQINYNIQAPGDVLLEVYNMIGNKVATLVQSRQNAGEHSVTFNAEYFPSGIYYYRLISEGQMEVRSMTLIK